jgi:protein phosphatase PTC7
MRRGPYLFRVLTSPRRGAGTHAPVQVLALQGQLGRIGPLPWWQDGFPPGSERVFTLPEQPDLGLLEVLEIQQAQEADGWLLQSVTVEGFGTQTLFPCGVWLGESDAADGLAGPLRVQLRRAPSSSAPDLPARRSLSRIRAAAAAIPQPEKVARGVRAQVGRFEGYAGEDAFYISPSQTRFGVADGVSQWSELGVDAGLFSRALTRGALKHGSLFAAAREATLQGVRGSSTITLAEVDLAKAQVSVKTLGDSKVVLARGGRVVERSVEQEHSFGVPFQLSSEIDGRDRPEHALSCVWDLQPGDALVSATDGLFDNLDEAGIAQYLTAHQGDAPAAARALAYAAWTASQEKFAKTPYSRAASEAFDLAFSGGKRDDVTVVVAFVD